MMMIPMVICMCMCMMMCMMSMMGGGPFGALFGGLGSALGGLGSAVGGAASGAGAAASGAGDLVGGAGAGVGKGLSELGSVLSGEAFTPNLTQITGTDRDKMMCVFSMAGKAEGRAIEPATITKCRSMGCPGYPDDVANCDFSTQFLTRN
jgi:hypothetical protein